MTELVGVGDQVNVERLPDRVQRYSYRMTDCYVVDRRHYWENDEARVVRHQGYLGVRCVTRCSNNVSLDVLHTVTLLVAKVMAHRGYTFYY